MSKTLDKIKAPIAGEMVAFEKHFRESMRSQVALLDQITFYIVKRKGKQIRPMFVFLCAKAVKDCNDNTFVAASLIELLHTASLVHDDVVDDAAQRRGFFSINALWKNKIAVLIGDYLLTRGLDIALKSKQYRQLEIVSDAVRMMSEGELLQIEKARKLDIKEEVYYEIIRQKTASLLASACSAGVASVTDDEEMIERFRSIGEHAGMAFQIKDDLFDFGKANIGKPKGIDIKEKKMTLPLIYALRNTDTKTRKSIINKIKKRSTDNEVVKEVIAFVHQSGGIEYAKEKMQEYHNKAIELLTELPESPARTSILELLKYVIEREK